MIENLRLDNTAEHNSDGSLAQDYHSSFAGLADSETANFSNSTVANSLYSIDGSTVKTISGSHQAQRFPRYNNVNTPVDPADWPQNPTTGAATNPTSNAGMYSYGNYYTWAAVIADTTDYPDRVIRDTTSIYPTGWGVPAGGSTSLEFGNLDISLGGHGEYQDNATASNRWRAYPNNFVLSGDITSSGSPSGRGSSGSYWTSRSNDGSLTYSAIVSRSYMAPGMIGSSKYIGSCLRCLFFGS